MSAEINGRKACDGYDVGESRGNGRKVVVVMMMVMVVVMLEGHENIL